MRGSDPGQGASSFARTSTEEWLVPIHSFCGPGRWALLIINCQMPYSLPDLMQLIVVERGEAVHLDDGEAPVLEIRGQLHRILGPRLESGDAQTLFRSIAPKAEFQAASRSGLAVFEVLHGENAFFRVMAFRVGDGIRVELRRML